MTTQPEDTPSLKGKSGEDNPKGDEVEFAIGCKLEAQDFSGVWYPARVEDVDWKGKEVLIHFERWSSKYDEWIAMDSSRLRSVQKPAPRKPPPTFERGQQVLASWSAYQKHLATIQRLLPDGKYEVLFEDGFVKRLPSSKIWRVNESYFSTQTNEENIGSKQDRRNRKRKLVVSELFRSNKKPKLSESTDKATVPPGSPSVPTTPDVPTVETSPRKPSSPISSIEVNYQDGRKETWTRSITYRTEGKTAGKAEILICSAAGKKFRARADLIRYCEENQIVYDPVNLDFSAKRRSKSFSTGSQKEVPQPTSSATVSAEPVIPTAAVGLPPPPQAPEGSERIFIGGLEVVVQDGQFICPVAECKKHFRKENLLHMHMKHYHPDLLKYLDYTPSVTDLAYARTVSNLEHDATPASRPVPRPDLRAPDVKRSPARTKEGKTDLAATSTDSGVPAPGSAAPDKSEEPIKAEPVEESLVIPAETTSSIEVCSTTDQVKSEQHTDCVKTAEEEKEVQVKSEYPSSAEQRPSKVHWKRRPYHRHQLPVPDWYGRLAKQPTVGTSSVGSGKETGEEPGNLVQRNPILNTLLSSRPLAPTLGWRSGWRRRRRGGWNRRRPPRALPSVPYSSPQSDMSTTLDETDPCPAATVEGSDPSKPHVGPNGVKYDKLRGHEIINCLCQIKEEDGLMIQCDVCQCWQHGHCLGIPPEGEVPESYVCSICKDPPKGRSSRKYYNHQDWLKQGVLPSLPFGSKPSPESSAVLKRAFDVSGQLNMMTRLFHSLRVKLSIARNKNHPKLWLWAHKWQETDQASESPPHPKPEDTSTPKAPEPEKPIDPLECKANLLAHIKHYEDLVYERLKALEAELTDLENSQGLPSGNEAQEHDSRTRATVKMLLRDLDTVKKVATLP